MNPKTYDQNAKQDIGKPKLSLVPTEIIRNIASVREYGNSKYPNGGKDNWKNVEPERYRDAAYRHFIAYIEDPASVDEESRLPHLWHLACNIAFLCEMDKKDAAPSEEEKDSMQIAKEQDGYWVDSNNNKWHTRMYTKEKAEKNSLSLTNCEDCTNCAECKNCIECSFCYGCDGCRFCKYCFSCFEAVFCHYCVCCYIIKHCYHCTYCRQCLDCSGFVGGSNLEKDVKHCYGVWYYQTL